MWSCHAAIPSVPRSIKDPAATNDDNMQKGTLPGARGGEGVRGEEGGVSYRRCEGMGIRSLSEIGYHRQIPFLHAGNLSLVPAFLLFSPCVY